MPEQLIERPCEICSRVVEFLPPKFILPRGSDWRAICQDCNALVGRE